MHFTLRLFIAAAVLLTLEFSGLWVTLLSHPHWSQSSTMQGIVMGVVLSMIGIWQARKGHPAMLVLAIWAMAATAMAYYLTWWGKSEFANSYAEDVFAGKIWFFGFKAVNAFLFCTLVFILSYKKPKP